MRKLYMLKITTGGQLGNRLGQTSTNKVFFEEIYKSPTVNMMKWMIRLVRK